MHTNALLAVVVLVVFAIAIKITINRKSKVKKNVSFLILTELSNRLLNFTATADDMESWEYNFMILSNLPLDNYEKIKVDEFKSLYEIYLLIYIQYHPTLTEKYGEKLVDASVAAKKYLLTTALWEAYQLICSNTRTYTSWDVKVKEVIDTYTSVEYSIQLANGNMDLVELMNLVDKARGILWGVKNTVAFNNDQRWHDKCDNALQRLDNLWRTNEQIEIYMDYYIEDNRPKIYGLFSKCSNLQ